VPNRYNWVASITGYFLVRKRIAVVLFLFLVLGGVAALHGLRREGFPQVPVKIVVVSTVYKGAAPGEVEHSVTDPIESALKDIKAVKSVQSTSSDSHSLVIATLNEDADADAGLRDVTSKVSGADLPKGADKPEIMQPTAGNSSFVFGLTGPFSNEDLLAQGRIFEREVSQIKGIKQVKLQSTFDDKVFVALDSAKVAAAGVDPSSIATTLQAQNANIPAGRPNSHRPRRIGPPR